jgi:photosynthetic reaction center cytochrome c subunit
MSIGLRIAIVLTVLVTAGIVFFTFERPPIESTQLGYRGLGMVEMTNPRAEGALRARNQVPAAQPAVAPGSPPANTVYKNVPVLGHLSVAEFTRLMVAITEWVSPQEGCNYCHAGGDLASDALYTKVVSRRMIQMTQAINGDWKNHVGGTGVTCFTCHRGQPVPAKIWFADPGPASVAGQAGRRAGQNAPAMSVALTSLPFDPFSAFLNRADAGAIRVISNTALPAGNPRTLMDAEWTYGLMMHMSDGLGVNCTFCHNSRSFFSWDASTPQRVPAYHGIQMVHAINETYLNPLQPTYPPNRLGPLGDAPKANCATCHQGVSKPLFGVSMLKDYPELAAAGKVAMAALPTPEPVLAGEVVIVYFGVASTALHEGTPRVLAVLVEKLKASPAAKATISGYHSATGDAAQNHDLARNRAVAVRDALKSAGIAEDRVVLEKPLAEQANVVGEDPRARRVEISVK